MSCLNCITEVHLSDPACQHKEMETYTQTYPSDESLWKKAESHTTQVYVTKHDHKM